MKDNLTYWLALGLSLCLYQTSVNAQENYLAHNGTSTTREIDKRIHNFQELKAMGYTEREIYEDLGNASFLSKKYDTAIYWYDQLMGISKEGHLEPNYQKRYDYAQSKIKGAEDTTQGGEENWTELILEDYQMTSVKPQLTQHNSRRKDFLPLNFGTGHGTAALGNATKLPNEGKALSYNSPVAVTADGQTAYYTRVVEVKPETGIFSKKEQVQKIFRADKINGEWKTIRELTLCPKEFSAIHPTITADGKRLFFASNMPGTYGEYDIYVADISASGKEGVAKNLGTKVNTEKNDLYPKIIAGNTLVFASEGHEGYGGLDMYKVEVNQNNVGLALNLGAPFNSPKDDFAIQLENKDGKGYIVSNRLSTGQNTQKLAFTFLDQRNGLKEEDYYFLEAANTDSMSGYSNTIFED